jgi:hypothetical protein
MLVLPFCWLGPAQKYGRRWPRRSAQGVVVEQAQEPGHARFKSAPPHRVGQRPGRSLLVGVGGLPQGRVRPDARPRMRAVPRVAKHYKLVCKADVRAFARLDGVADRRGGCPSGRPAGPARPPIQVVEAAIEVNADLNGADQDRRAPHCPAPPLPYRAARRLPRRPAPRLGGSGVHHARRRATAGLQVGRAGLPLGVPGGGQADRGPLRP